MIDSTGKIIIPNEYDELSSILFKKYIIVTKENYKGIVTTSNIKLSPIQFKELEIIDSLSYKTLDSNKWKIHPIYEKSELQTSYSQISYFNKNLYITKNNFLYGVITNNKEILPNLYSSITFIDSIFVHKKDKKYGCSLYNGKTILENEWDNLDVCNKHIIVKKDSLYGIFSIDKNMFISNIEYSNISCSHKNFFVVKKNNSYGVVFTSNKEIIPAVYSSLEPTYTDSATFYLLATLNNKQGLYSNNGKLIIPIKYSIINMYNYGIFTCYDNKAFALYNIFGKELYPLKASQINIYKEQIKVYDDSKIIVIEIDKNGNEKIRYEYENVSTLRIKNRNEDVLLNPHFIFNVNSNFMSDTNSANRYGWFLDNNYWGLQDTLGQVRFRPFFNTIMILDSNYTIVSKKEKIDGEQQKFFYHNTSDKVFGIVKHSEYKYFKIPEFKYIRLDCNDSLNKIFIVAYTFDKWNFITQEKNMYTKNFTFIDRFYEGYARVCLNGKYYRTEFSNRETIANFYPFVRLFNTIQDDWSRMRYLNIDNGKWGIIDCNGTIQIPIEYDYIDNIRHGCAIVKKDNKWGIVSTSNKTIIPINYDNITYQNKTNDSLFSLQKNNSLFGLLDSTGTFITTCLFHDIYPFSNSIARVKIQNKFMYINIKGNYLNTTKYNKARDFNEGLAAVCINNKWGYIDTNGNIAIAPQYYKSGDFNDDLAWIREKRKIGYINKNGQKIIAPKYNVGDNFISGIASVKKNKKWGIINKEGKYLIRPKFKKITFDKDDEIIFCLKGNKTVLYTWKGKKIKAFKFSKISEFSSGLAYIKTWGKYGYINKTGEIVIKPIYNNAQVFSNGLAGVAIKDTWTFINTKGEYLLPFKYNTVYPFIDSITCVDYNNHTYIINTKGDVLDSIRYTKGNSIINNTIKNGGEIYFLKMPNYYRSKNITKYFISRIQNTDVLFENTGKIVCDIHFKNLKKLENGMYAYKINSYYNISDLQGNIIFDENFEKIDYMGKGIYKVYIQNMLGYINENGSWIWEPQN